MKDAGLWVAVGGVAVVGGYLYWRQQQAYTAPVASPGGWDILGELNSLFEPQPARTGLPVSGPGAYTQQAGPLPVARLGPTGPSGTEIGIKSGMAVGTGAAIGAIGPGSVLAGTLTAGIGAGIGVLAWAIGSKGLFRGGEEALYVNPARDRYLAFFGPPGTGPGSGFHNLAARLTEITGEPNGSHYFSALKAADTTEKLIKATLDIQQVFASVGEVVPAFVE